jgi:hypothetical protein
MSDEMIEVLMQKLNIDLLPHITDGNLVGIGIRVRPYGKGANTGVMLLGYGATIDEALEDIYAKAHEGRWERLDWAARPWPTDAYASATGVYGGPLATR